MSVRIPPRLTQAAAIFLCLAAASAARAQTLESNSASFNAGYGRVAGEENRPVANFSLRDANGNLIMVNGEIQSAGVAASSASSAFASATASASGSFSGGVGGQSSASAIGNNLTVITQGNDNTVIVNSTQTNTGKIVAGATTTGGVSNAH